MIKRSVLTVTLLTGTFAGIGLGMTAARLTPTAQAAPFPAAAAPAGPVAEMLAGKAYPLTLKAEQIDSSYHLAALIDAQGRPSQYATRGETVTAGSETFLVCYDISTTSSPGRPPQPKAGATGQLIFINLRAVQAMAGIVPIQPAADPAAPAAALP